jgi:hypothetical protein
MPFYASSLLLLAAAAVAAFTFRRLPAGLQSDAAEQTVK